MAGYLCYLNSVYGYWDPGTSTNYSTLHDASSASWLQGGSPQGSQHEGAGWFQLKRGIADFDLTEVPESLTILSAKIVAVSSARESTNNDVFGVLLDATGVTAGNNGYGEMLYKVVSIGSLFIPSGTYQIGLMVINFNAAGLTFLESKAGGLARVGFRMDEDIANNEPDNETERFGINPYNGSPGVGVPYIHINYLPTVAGCIWVEGNNLAYIDNNLDKRVKTGTLEGATGKTAGTHWVEGTKQRYIDSSGNERYIEGTLTGLTGKLASQLSINTKSPMLGTHYCYIDDDGAERCFEGTAS